MARLGVFCGTFNPIHWGHLLMAEFARRQLSLERVLFITSPNPPHRHHDILNAELRHSMVSAAVADNPYFQSSRLELERSGPSFTVDTLKQIKRDIADADLYLIIGEDNLQYIGKWKQADEIFAMSGIVVAPRTKQIVKPTDPQTAVPVPKQARVVFLDIPHVNVSGSEIRRRLREGKSVLYLVPSAVNRLLIGQKVFV